MEPTPEEAADGSILVKVLAAVLERLVNSNTSTARSDPGQLTKFHALKAPGICVEAYLERIHKYASCSNECFILALIYIDRLIERNNFLLTELNVHRVVVTAVLLAAKFFDDAYYNNAYYAKVGGVLVSELNGLEVDFLFRINFSLHAQSDEFEKYKAELVAHSINSGIIPAQIASSVSVSQQLPHIPEMDTGSRGGHSLRNRITNPFEGDQHREQEPQQPTMQVKSTGGGNCDCIMSIRAHVTPSPSNSLEDLSRMTSDNMTEGHPIQKYEVLGANLQAPKATDELMTMIGATDTAPLEPTNPISRSSNNLFTQQQDQQSLLLQRANSLPRFTSRSCVDHAFKLPYSAPTMPATAPIVAVDQVQYQLMVNQLFPIENTLVHHEHQGIGTSTTSSATIQDHHSSGTAGLVGHHTGLRGTGLGPLAYQVSWSGQIRQECPFFP